jgi:hypothetical protein
LALERKGLSADDKSGTQSLPIWVPFVTSTPEMSCQSDVASVICIMDSTVVLLQKLGDIERALEIEERATIRNMLLDAQQYVLQLQRESPEQMRRDSRVVCRH